jgi:hypothetical protein
VPAPLVAAALLQVLRHWKSQPTRNSEREEAVTRIELVSGLDAAYCVLNRGRPFDPALYITDARDDDVIDIGCRAAPEPQAPTRTVEPLQCSSHDRSHGGLRLSYRGDSLLNPNVGQLFALRRAASASAAWVVAICRWLEGSESVAGFDMGLQYLAREPEAVVIRPLDGAGLGGEYQPAIVAIQKRAEQRVHTLIARGQQLAVGRSFVIHTRSGQQQARCSELLESGYGFDRFIYQPEA